MRTALLLGYPYHTRTLANFVNANSKRWRIIAGGVSRMWRYRGIASLPFVDAVLGYGGPAPDALVVACARRLHKPIAVIWGGTDVVKVRNMHEAAARTRAQRLRHVACSPETADELGELGISASVLRLAVATPPQTLAPLGAFRVLAYLPGNNDAIYGTQTVLEAAARLPDVPFEVIGNRSIRETKTIGNITYRGWVDDATPLIDMSTVLLRPTQRDGGGPPLMVLEALARGRYVIWSRPCHGTLIGKRLEEVMEHLRRLYEMQQAGRLDLNVEGVEWIRRCFAPDTVTREIEEFLDELVARCRSLRGARAVVTGSPGAVADFLEHADGHALVGRSRTERLDDALAMFTSKRWIAVDGADLDPLVKAAAQLLRKRPELVLTDGRPH
ncbi:MAG TPA: hypothetical protein VMD07_10870 [Candidatus Acidoferrales bacterium]|nr:hypothetical protein [Candidatus Acidoferrales bacterium]